MQDFRRLEVWQAAHALTIEIYRLSKLFPNDKLFGLTSQLRRSCSSIEANLAEGCGRGSDKDFGRFVQIAIGSSSEAECHLLLARDLGYINEEIHRTLEVDTQRVKKRLISSMKRLNQA